MYRLKKYEFAFPSVPRWCAEADAQPAVFDTRRHEPRTNVFHYNFQPFIYIGIITDLTFNLKTEIYIGVEES